MDELENLDKNIDASEQLPIEEDEQIEIIEDNTPNEHAPVEMESHEEHAPEYNEEDEEGQKKRKAKPQRDPQISKLNNSRRELHSKLSQREKELNIISQEYNRILKENEALRNANKYSTEAAVTNYETSTLDRLDRAKERKARALEMGDVKEQIDADVALSTALNEYERLKTWKENQRLFEQQQQQEQEQQQYYNQYQQPQYEQPQNQTPNIQYAQEWHQQNDWFNEQSENYDPETKEFALLLSNSMDAELYRNGLQSELYSPEYFEYLDQKIEEFREGKYNDRRRYSPPTPRSQHSMQRNQHMTTTPRNIVSPVSGSGYRTNSNVNNRKQVRLTPEQIKLANNLALATGIRPEDYAKETLLYQEKKRNDAKNGIYDRSR